MFLAAFTFLPCGSNLYISKKLVLSVLWSLFLRFQRSSVICIYLRNFFVRNFHHAKDGKSGMERGLC
jgi:hypothetical protein